VQQVSLSLKRVYKIIMVGKEKLKNEN